MTSTKPEFQKVGDQFYWRPAASEKPIEYVIPLVFKTRVYRDLSAAGDVILSLAVVLTSLKLPEALEALDDLELHDGNILAERYFEALQEQNGASAGK